MSLTYKEIEDIEGRYMRLTDSKKVAINLMLLELEKAEAKHPDPWAITKGDYDYLYAASVVGEEAGELVKEAMSVQHEGAEKFAEMMEEAAQTGCTVIRFLTNTPIHWEHRKQIRLFSVCKSCEFYKGKSCRCPDKTVNEKIDNITKQ